MARRVQPSQERLMFPAWSVNTDDLPDMHILSRRRRRCCKTWARRIITVACVMTILWIWKRKAASSDAALNGMLSRSEFEELGISGFQRPYMKSDNPWRGAGRRVRGDIVISVSGCGGSFRKAITSGDKVSVRYSIRSFDGRVLDSSKGSADVLIGTRQVDKEMEDRLHGLCAGEAVRFDTKDERRVLLYIDQIGETAKKGRSLEDQLAKLVRTVGGRKGRSCNFTCRNAGFVCEEKGLVVVNNCPRLRETFNCMKCEVAAAGSSGADMPALVVKSAPVGHARGACLVARHGGSSRCDAKYAYTRRLCACFEEDAVRRVLQTL